MAKPESALVVLVPEAESLVRPYRERFDPSAALGVPAHITLLYPFIGPERIGADSLDKVAACLSGFAPIAFSLTAVRRFPAETLYLAPDPDEPFRQLTKAIRERFPDTPPYGAACLTSFRTCRWDDSQMKRSWTGLRLSSLQPWIVRRRCGHMPAQLS